MSAKYDENLLLGYIEEELDASQRAVVEQWMASDAHLGRLMRAMMADRAMLRDLQDPAPPEWVMDEVDRQLERSMLVDAAPMETESVVIRQRWVLRRLTAGLAIAAMVGLVGWVVAWSLWNVEQTPDLVALISGQDPTQTTPVEPGPGQPTPAAQPEMSAEGDNATLPAPPAAPATADSGAMPPAIPAAPTTAAAEPEAEVMPPAPSDPAPLKPHTPIVLAPPLTPPTPMITVPSTEIAPTGVLADIGVDHGDLLKGPQPQVAGGEDVLRSLRQIQRTPNRAADMIVRLVSGDMHSTKNLVLQMLPPGTPVVTAARQGQPATDKKALRIDVPIERLEQVLVFLHTDANLTRAAFERRTVLAAGALPQKGGSLSATLSPWPAVKPDYAALLRQQVTPPAPPLAPADDRPAPSHVPIVIEPAAQGPTPSKPIPSEAR